MVIQKPGKLEWNVERKKLSFDSIHPSTGVIGRRIKMEQLFEAVPVLASQISSSVEDAKKAAIAITTTGHHAG
eukprot:scaffold66848_cov46-Prasinocladus_malaysianus.AAC.3